MCADKETTHVEQAIPDDQIICAVSGAPAELFVRNPRGRLVPMTRDRFQAMHLMQLRLREKGSTAPVFDEIPLDAGSAEYWLQEPTEVEKKRRAKSLMFRGLRIRRLIYSTSGPTPDEELPRYLGEGESIADFVISRLANYPVQGTHTVVIATHALEESDIRGIWDAYLAEKPPKE